MKQLTVLIAIIIFSCSSSGGSTPDESTERRLEFFGLTQTIAKNIDIIFRSSNLGDIKPGDTLEVLGVSARHLFIAKEIRLDSLEDKNFIGDFFEENGKVVSYFDRRLKARYVLTLPVDDYALAVETADFYRKSTFFVCAKFFKKIKGIRWNPDDRDVLLYKNAAYNFADRNITTEKGDTVAMEDFLRVKINTGSWNDLIVLFDNRETERNIRVFLNKDQVAEILFSLGRY